MLDNQDDGLPTSDGGREVTVISDDQNDVVRHPDGSIEIKLPDGSVEIDLNGDDDEQDDDGDFDANLAEKIEESELARIATEVLDGIDADDNSRKEWLSARTDGLDLLGLKLEKSTGASSDAPLEGMSTVRHPLLLESVLRFQATARGELLPSTGPCKVRNDGDGTGDKEELAEELERDFNHWLTAVATEYYPDTDRMLFLVGFGGCGFKKVYNCPIRRRPASDSVDAKDIIVSNAATDLKSSPRVTHRTPMRSSVLKRMQLVGAYRKVDLTQPAPEKTKVDEKMAEIQGVKPTLQRPEDEPYTIDECYCELDIKGYEHKDEKDDKVTGLPLPYKVSIERTSRKILEIRRNWDEDDETCLAKVRLVKYPYVPGLGFYDIGLLHILGNSTRALTAAWREMLDAGMYASFPGFLYAKSSGRQSENQFRIPPGGGHAIDTAGNPITQMVMPLPYRDASPGLMQLTQNIDQNSQRVGGTADMAVSEGKQEAPVGTTLALIEQATKIQDAVHKRLHAAQAEEFQLLKECFREDPEAFWRHNSRRCEFWNKEKFLKALNDCDLVPAADPNTPSHMHRVMKAVAVKQLQQANPELYNAREVDTRILRMIGWNDPDSLFAPPAPPAGMPPPDPIAVETLKLKDKELNIKQEGQKLQTVDKAAERKSKEDIAVLGLAKEIAIHAENQQSAFQTLETARPPASTGGRVL